MLQDLTRGVLLLLTLACLEVGLGLCYFKSITGHCIARMRTTDLVLLTQDMQILIEGAGTEPCSLDLDHFIFSNVEQSDQYFRGDCSYLFY